MLPPILQLNPPGAKLSFQLMRQGIVRSYFPVSSQLQQGFGVFAVVFNEYRAGTALVRAQKVNDVDGRGQVGPFGYRQEPVQGDTFQSGCAGLFQGMETLGRETGLSGKFIKPQIAFHYRQRVLHRQCAVLFQYLGVVVSPLTGAIWRSTGQPAVSPFPLPTTGNERLPAGQSGFISNLNPIVPVWCQSPARSVSVRGLPPGCPHHWPQNEKYRSGSGCLR